MNPHLDSDLLRTFVAIADMGSFTRASEAVGRTQSAVSMQVKKLEETVGQPLFARGARGVTLTPGGETLLTSARRVMALLDEAGRSLRRAPLEGHVRVGIPEEYGSTLLPDVLARFAQIYPGVQVTVRCEGSADFAVALERGELDLAVIVSDLRGEHGQILIHDPTVWVTSARHFVHEDDPLPLAMFERDCWWRDWALRSLDQQGRRYRVAYSSASVAGIQAAVTSGLAVAVLGQSTIPAGARPLTEDEGFSPLPASSVVLQRGAGASTQAVERMAAVVSDAFRTDA